MQLQTLATYIDWETDQRARNPKHPGKSPETDLALTRAIFERTVALHSRIVAPLVASLASLELVKPKKTSRKGKDKAQEEGEAESMSRASLHAYKQAEAAIWEKYAIWLASDSFSHSGVSHVQEDSESKESALLVRQRAVRACPQIGSAWSALLTSMVSQKYWDLPDNRSRKVETSMKAPLSSSKDWLLGCWTDRARRRRKSLISSSAGRLRKSAHQRMWRDRLIQYC